MDTDSRKQNIQMPKLIKLSDYGNRVKDIQNLRNKIRENLGEAIFEIKDFQTLQYEALRQISFVRNGVANTPESIEAAAKKVLNKLKLFRVKAKLYDLSGDKPVRVKTTPDSPVQQFNEWILGFDSTPYEHLVETKGIILNHLEYLNGFVRYYEEHPYIQNYKNKGKPPGNGEERLILDFYKRCQDELSAILYFLFDGVKKVAIRKANTSMGISYLKSLFKYPEFPYKIWKPYSEELFDHKKINKSKHRIFDI